MHNTSSGYQNISPRELRDKIERKDDFLLLDVRTSAEHYHEAIEGSTLLPVQEMGYWANELPKGAEIVVYCRVGNRSAFAAAHLAQLGYTVMNLEGGIREWKRAERGVVSVA